ncbi:MAG: helix-turn-helix transcriptional regulator [Muribaculaceae bacterium]|nr:helix-turn-helix transcriptional regulator [Muribaculaceae bacterium]MDE6315199.1 helix-turn-helix transcriptional regulator [Muribaculaceae bacterium]
MKDIDQNTISAGEYCPAFGPGTPFMVEGCMILQCVDGTAAFSLNFRRHDIGRGDIVFLFNDMVVMLDSRSDDFRVRYVTVTATAVFGIYMRITVQRFWDRLYLMPVQRFDSAYGRGVDNWMSECLLVSRLCTPAVAAEVVSELVVSFFRVMEDIVSRSAEVVPTQFANSPWKIVGDFFVLLSRNYTVRHNVGFYADALSVTPDYLSSVTRACTGLSAKQIIENRLVLAMKAMLESTVLPIKDIASRLHFEDSSHLCRVFRRHTSMSPLEYRRLRSVPS